jgi:hypothetical protein
VGWELISRSQTSSEAGERGIAAVTKLGTTPPIPMTTTATATATPKSTRWRGRSTRWRP